MTFIKEMDRRTTLCEGELLKGPLFNEPMRIETVRSSDDGTIRDPARIRWNEVRKVAHYRLEVNAMTRPMTIKEGLGPYGEKMP